jgi:SNF2 family DNA or RNA helicase
MNLRAGGCGLNLVQANHIILMEPYWNDAEEQQASNRIYRIGQTKPVTVYKLIVKNSIEMWLLRLQKSKDSLSSFLLDSKDENDAAGIANEKSKTKQFFKFIKELKIDENAEKLVDEYIKTEQ